MKFFVAGQKHFNKRVRVPPPEQSLGNVQTTPGLRHPASEVADDVFGVYLVWPGGIQSACRVRNTAESPRRTSRGSRSWGRLRPSCRLRRGLVAGGAAAAVAAGVAGDSGPTRAPRTLLLVGFAEAGGVDAQVGRKTSRPSRRLGFAGPAG